MGAPVHDPLNLLVNECQTPNPDRVDVLLLAKQRSGLRIEVQLVPHMSVFDMG